MSVSLATVADALIEFILSLLRDPAAAANFAEEPDAALGARGLSNVGYNDVCAVAPIVMEKTHVVPAPDPGPPAPHPNPVVREILNIVNNHSYIDDRDTIVDQSVNQNIWALGDVTQHFDQEALVVSGDGNVVAGDDMSFEEDYDLSTNIGAGGDVVLGDQTTTDTTTVGSNNSATDNSTNTATVIDADITNSGNSSPTTAEINDSFNQDSANTTTTTDTTTVYVDANVVDDSTATVIADGEF